MVIFLVVAYVNRILAGFAGSGAYLSFFDIYTKMFPNKVAKMMAATELFFGVGWMLGINGLYSIYPIFLIIPP